MASQVISFHCTLKNKFGHVLSRTTNCNILSTQEPVPGRLSALAEALRELRKGEKRTVFVKAKDAYGFYDLSLVVTRLREDLVGGDKLKVGESVKYIREGVVGNYRVIEATPLEVTLDGNHPFAGQDLVFEIEATEAREAAPEESMVEFTRPGSIVFH